MATTVKSLPPFNPRSIANCALWLDAADTTSIVLSGSNVSQWRDKSGQGNHMNQYSAATAPTTSNLNGLNTVYFFTSDPTSVQGTPPFTNVKVLQGTNFQTTVDSTLFLVVYPLYVATSTKFIVNLKSRVSNQWNNLYDINMGTGDGTNAGGFGSFIRTDTSFLGVNSSYYTINTTNLTSAEIVGTTVSFYKDASLYRSGSVSLAMPASDNFQVFTLGAYLNTDIYDTTSKMGSRAHFCEVIVYNGSLTTSQRQQVEGYLAWKWGITASLPSIHPFKRGIVPFPFSIVPTRARGVAFPTFDPRTISNCSLWLDSADSSTISFSNSDILSIRDKSSSLLLFSASATPPTRSSTRYNGVFPIQFSGNSFLSNSTFTYTLNNRSAFLVCGETSSVNNAGFLSFALTGNDFSSQSAIAYESGFKGANQQFQVAKAFGNGGFALSIAGSTATPFALYGDTFGSGTEVVYRNGSQQATATVVQTFTNSTGLYVGARMTGGAVGNYLTGVIAEVILFNRQVSISERQQIEGYLAWKWGLQTSLPSDHPFRLIAPNPFQLTAPRKVGIFRPPIVLVSLSGGTKITANGFTYHLFTASGSLTTVTPGTVNYLVVGGGGGGGDRHGGGGGAGGVLSGTFTASGSYTVTVGNGGSFGAAAEGRAGVGSPFGAGTKGGNSSISGIATAFGGGGGGTVDGNPTNVSGSVGSGGGGGGVNLPGIAGTTGQGNAGGAGSNPGGGGGGGAGGAGANANTSTGGIGTAAFSSHLLAVGYGTTFATSPNNPISGGVAYIAGGGGGAANSDASPTARAGGLGGGGVGDWNDSVITAGTPNTGGGGGASRSFNVSTAGRDGGSGLVLVWY